MARFITVPGTLMVDVGGETKTFAWEEFVKAITHVPQFAAGWRDAFEAIDKYRLLTKHVNPGDVIELADADWVVIEAIARRPQVPMFLYFHLEPYMRAVCDAPTTDPRRT